MTTQVGMYKEYLSDGDKDCPSTRDN